jgi:hypothetical protein
MRHWPIVSKGPRLDVSGARGYSVRMSLILTYGAALVLGSVHALEADHLSAVTAFATRHPRWRQAARFGFRWALGHGTAVVLVGASLILLEREAPLIINTLLERLVGLVLIGLGAWSVRNSRRIHAHAHRHADGNTHVHVHSHALGEGHIHRHGATSVGLLHGTAGAAPAAALIPLASLDAPAEAIGFLVLFALGTMAAMTMYALLAGWLVGRAAEASVRFARGLAAAAGCATIGVGIVWLLR